MNAAPDSLNQLAAQTRSFSDLRLFLATLRLRSKPFVSADEAYRLAGDAIEDAKARHRDIDRCLPYLPALCAMAAPDWSLTTLPEVLEMWIAVLKYANFTAETRRAAGITDGET